MQNISTSGLFWAKSQFLVGKISSFWMILLEFLETLLEVFLAWVFLALSFFFEIPKKACMRLLRINFGQIIERLENAFRLVVVHIRYSSCGLDRSMLWFLWDWFGWCFDGLLVTGWSRIYWYGFFTQSIFRYHYCCREKDIVTSSEKNTRGGGHVRMSWVVDTPWERTAGFASLFLIDIDTIYMVLWYSNSVL